MSKSNRINTGSEMDDIVLAGLAADECATGGGMTEVSMDDQQMAENHPCDEIYDECIRSHRKLADEAVKANPNASNRELAKDLPVSKDAIRRAKNRAGGATAPEHDPSGVKAALRADPSRRNTEIAKDCGVTECTVRQTRKRMGMSASAATRRKNPTPTPPPRLIEPSEHKETIQEAIRKGKYSAELLDWIFTYQSWSKRMQKQAREVFFAIINGVSTNGAVAASATNPFRPLDGKVTAH
jgi:hypothetical protein